MKYRYTILYSFNTNKVLPSVGNIVDEVNHHMEGFGFSEKLVLRSERVQLQELTSDIELVVEERDRIAIQCAQIFEKNFPGSNPEVELVRA